MDQPRDVTQTVKSKNLFMELIHFLKEPIRNINWVHSLTLKNALLLQIGISAVAGALSGIIGLNYSRILLQALLSPLIGLLISFLGAFFLYYYLSLFERKETTLAKVFALMVVANCPFFLLQFLTELLPAIYLIGFAFTALILLVGLVEIFQLPRKRARNFVAFIYIFILSIWMTQQLMS